MKENTWKRLNTNSKNVLETITPYFFFLQFILYILYFILFLGVFTMNPLYVHYLAIAVHLFICVFLMIRFNPFTISELQPMDTRIIFGSSILLLINVVFVELGIIIDVKSITFSSIYSYLQEKINKIAIHE
jgi:hypothetical protein